MDAGGYTYVRLGAGMPGGEEIWAAGPVTKVAVGDTVIMVNPMSMSNFTSKTLNRTFDKIYFTDAFKAPGDVPAAAPSSGAPSVSQGVVQETMDSGGYTYIQVKAGDASVWLAAPQTPVEKGATISWDGAMPMRQFTSKTLNRTFDEILFVGGIKVVSGS
jgi:hypothetical protein